MVAVDTLARYEGPDGTFVVSSCDVYEFADDKVSAITSYAVEVDKQVDTEADEEVAAAQGSPS